MSTIRLAKKSDVKSIWEIRTQAIIKTCISHYAEETIDAWANSPMPEGFDNILIQLGAIVCEENGTVLGFGFIDTENKSLESLFISPAHSGEGLGKLIALELQTIARGAAVDTLTLSSSLNAVRFYESVGFTAGEAVTWRHPSGFELDSVPMYKTL